MCCKRVLTLLLERVGGQTDHDFAWLKADEAFSSAAALQSPYRSVAPLLHGRRSDATLADTSMVTPATRARVRPTVCAEAVVGLLRGIADRFRVLHDAASQLKFVNGIQRPLLRRMANWLRQQAKACSILTATPTSEVRACLPLVPFERGAHCRAGCARDRGGNAS